MSAYDDNAPSWAQHRRSSGGASSPPRPWLSGGFVWTGFDYRGEPTPYGWPCINSHFGILDTCGFPKDNFWYYQSWWTDQPVLHLLPHWNWPGREGQEIDVRAFSNCDEVELFLNGQSLGRQTMKRALRAEVEGELRARHALRQGLPTPARSSPRPRSKPPARPRRSSSRPTAPTINADGEDVTVITVSVVDAQGRVVPMAANAIAFELEGPGRIIGVGNGDPSCHEPDVFVAAAAAAHAGARRLALAEDRRPLRPETCRRSPRHSTMPAGPRPT